MAHSVGGKTVTLQQKYEILLDTIQQFSGNQHPELTRRYITTFKQHLPPDKYPRILDIGLGEGPQELQQLRDAGYDVYGVNIQEWRADDDRSIVGDMNDQHVPPGSFDGAYSTQVFEHGYIPWLCCMETWISLRHGGRLYFNVPHCNTHQTVMHPSLMSLGRWQQILRQTGYNIILAREYDIHAGNLIFEIIAEKSKPENNSIKQAYKRLEKIRVGKV